MLGYLAFGLASAQADDALFNSLKEQIEDLPSRKGIFISATAYVDGKTRNLAGPSPDTLFEIGSITKALTGLLVADMVLKKEIALEDSLNPYLPEDVRRPVFETVTLEQLATHTSSLPRLPPSLFMHQMVNGMTLGEQVDPYRYYREEHLWRDLKLIKLVPAPDAYRYSNLGYGLLGHLIARKQEGGYESLLHERVLAPLGMADTFVYYPPGDTHVPPSSKAKAIPGFNLFGEEAAYWVIHPSLAAAGGIKSTPGDMAKIFRLALEGKPETLQPAWDLATQPRLDIHFEDTQIGLAWMITGQGDDRIIWHNGMTGGFSSFIGFCPARKRGVCLLSNQGGVDRITGIGLHWLTESPESEETDQSDSGK